MLDREASCRTILQPWPTCPPPPTVPSCPSPESCVCSWSGCSPVSRRRRQASSCRCTSSARWGAAGRRPGSSRRRRSVSSPDGAVPVDDAVASATTDVDEPSDGRTGAAAGRRALATPAMLAVLACTVAAVAVRARADDAPGSGAVRPGHHRDVRGRRPARSRGVPRRGDGQARFGAHRRQRHRRPARRRGDRRPRPGGRLRRGRCHRGGPRVAGLAVLQVRRVRTAALAPA